jgi:transposase
MVGFWYSAVHVKSEQSHRVKALLGSRDQLVRAERALGNQVRGVLRPFGIRLPSRQGTKKFSTAAHQAVRHDAIFNASVTALLEALAAIEAQIAGLQGVGATLASLLAALTAPNRPVSNGPGPKRNPEKARSYSYPPRQGSANRD